MVGNYVIVHLINSRDFSNPIFIIDIERGVTARLKERKNTNDSFRIEDNKLIVKDCFGDFSYELDALFEAIKL